MAPHARIRSQILAAETAARRAADDMVVIGWVAAAAGFVAIAILFENLCPVNF